MLPLAAIFVNTGLVVSAPCAVSGVVNLNYLLEEKKTRSSIYFEKPASKYRITEYIL